MPSPLSFRPEAKQVLSTLFGIFVLLYANFYLAHLTTAVCFAYILAFFIVYDVFLLSNYALHNLTFVLNSWHYFKVQ